MKIKRQARKGFVTLASVLALACAPVSMSHAFTECSNLVLTRVFTDGGNNFYVATGGDLNGIVPSDAASFKTIVAIALAAKATGATVTIRYRRDGVTCGSAAWHEVIEGIGM